MPSIDTFIGTALSEIDLRRVVELDELAGLIAARLGLSGEARAEVIAYDGEPVVRARTRLALGELQTAGLVERAGSAYALTPLGVGAVGKVAGRAGLSTYPAYAAYEAKRLAYRGA